MKTTGLCSQLRRNHHQLVTREKPLTSVPTFWSPGEERASLFSQTEAERQKVAQRAGMRQDT
jgi:hypothetical protein